MHIQCSIGGYSGPNITMLASFDESLGVLNIVKTTQVYHPERMRDDLALVTNLRLKAYDCFLSDDQIAGAIPAYFQAVALGTLRLAPELARYAPDTKVQVRSVGEGGRNYEIQDSIDCGQMAVLALAAYLQIVQTNESVAGAWDELYGGFSV
jgi:hypothetical protein